MGRTRVSDLSCAPPAPTHNKCEEWFPSDSTPYLKLQTVPQADCTPASRVARISAEGISGVANRFGRRRFGYLRPSDDNYHTGGQGNAGSQQCGQATTSRSAFNIQQVIRKRLSWPKTRWQGTSTRATWASSISQLASMKYSRAIVIVSLDPTPLRSHATWKLTPRKRPHNQCNNARSHPRPHHPPARRRSGA